MKRLHTIGLQVFLLFFFFYLNREPHLVLSFSKVSEPHSLWRRGDLLETQGFTLDDLEKNSRRSRLLVPTCRPHTVGQALMAEGHLATSPASNQRAGEKASILPHHPIPPVPAPPFSVSVVQQRYCLHSRFRHTISPPLPSC